MVSESTSIFLWAVSACPSNLERTNGPLFFSSDGQANSRQSPACVNSVFHTQKKWLPFASGTSLQAVVRL